mmetsp:Transcript_40663/g.95605  ORF Transcript_40663/g.95605 Transcript_40663/m.95605 type:complete len:470 (+) Transcript_40663:87-1496(+)
MPFSRSAFAVTLGAVCVASTSAFAPQAGMPLPMRLAKSTSARNPLSTVSMAAQDDQEAFNRRNLLQRVAKSSVAAAILGPVAAKVSNAVTLAEVEEEQIKLFQDAVPSVCFISTEYTSMAAQLNLDPTQLPKGVGSGFVWDDMGHIVTNFHVINKVDNAMVTVTQPDGSTKQYKAKLTGVDPDKDLAVLKIDAPKQDLRKLPVGESAKTRVGQFTYAIGNPFGQDHTLTSGVISGMNRQITSPTGRKINGVLQTDAAINPGNSGGPLLDRAGRVIGINTASLGAGVSAGVGFAIPIDAARGVVEQLIEFGQVQRAILGISYLERLPTALESEKSGIPRIEKGVVVLEVPPNSPGASAGLKAVYRPPEKGAKPVLGDVIVGIDKYDIASPADLSETLAKFKPGDLVAVRTLRGPEQEKTTLKVKLGAFKGSSFTKLENERGADFAKDGQTINVPLGEIAPAMDPKLPSAN